MKLDQRVAIITGASGGLGAGIARRFAEEGASVALLDVNLEGAQALASEIVAGGGRAKAWRCDVSSSADVAMVFAAVEAEFGGIHILVNNAALVPGRPADEERRRKHYAHVTTAVPRQSLEITKNMSDEEWKRFFAVNVDGVFYCTREALKRMEAQHYGRIINVSSIAGISGASAHSPHYSASKGAVVAFTRAVAVDVAGANVLVNAICPGGIQTPAFESYLGGLSEQERNTMWQIAPIGRLGKPGDYAGMVAYLASEECYCVGSIINISGGAVI